MSKPSNNNDDLNQAYELGRCAALEDLSHDLLTRAGREYAEGGQGRFGDHFAERLRNIGLEYQKMAKKLREEQERNKKP